MNNNDLGSNTFTWALEQPPQTQTQSEQQSTAGDNNSKLNQAPFGLSDADLFQLLLGEDVQQDSTCMPIDMEQDFPSNSDSNHSGSPSVQEQKYNYPTTKSTKSTTTVPAAAISRLDFRPISYIPESQLKAMTSKERRQVRNKISARNFRNRRKEYIGTLEEELNQQKSENSQLKLELKWAKAKMDELQKENDKMRVDLMLGGMVIPQQSPPASDVNNTSPCLFDSNTFVNPTLNLSASSSSDESTLSSPPNLFTDFPDNWDFVLPSYDQHDTYLSHAVVPAWNINQILSKETDSMIHTNSNQLFIQYPLLAPALMSIVLSHTMTMSTDDLLASAKLAAPTNFQVTSSLAEKDIFRSELTDKEAKAVWDILEPISLMKERNSIVISNLQTEQTTGKVVSKNRCTGTLNSYICPISWFQSRVIRFFCEYIENHCPRLDKPHEHEKKYRLCRQLQRARRYITA